MLWDISHIYHYIIFTFYFTDNDQVDINTTDEHVLRTIRGVEPKILSNIRKERNKRKFENKDDLLNRVSKFPESAIKKIKFTRY